MDFVSLKTMCESLNLTRRTIQCYEQAGLMRATDKNKYGHLLYDEESMKRAAKIRFLQELGFKLKEISGLIDAPQDVLIEELEVKVQELEMKCDRLTKLLEDAKFLIKSIKL